MKRYDLVDWERLGLAVKFARRKAELDDMKEWATRVGRSSRILQGLERGEVVGEKTLFKIEEVLGWPHGRCLQILEGEQVTVTRAGEVLLHFSPTVTVMRESGEVLGQIDVYGSGDEDQMPDWAHLTDMQISILIIEAAEQLRKRAIARFHTDLGGEGYKTVAEVPDYSSDDTTSYLVEKAAARKGASMGQSSRAAQDAAAEDPP